MPLGVQQQQQPVQQPQQNNTPSGLKSQLESIHCRLSGHDNDLKDQGDLLQQLNSVFDEINKRLESLEKDVGDLDEYLHN